MTDARALTGAAVVLSVLSKKLAAVNADVRERLTMALERGDRKAGYAGPYKIGAATLTDPKPAWRVTNRAAFIEWVREHRPEEIHTIEAVNAAFEKAVLDQGGFVDATTGEVVAVPGTEVVIGTPVLQVRTEAGAEEAIRAELDRGGLSFTAILDGLSRGEIGQ